MKSQKDQGEPNITLQTFRENWNAEFPCSTLTIDDFKKPVSIMGALLQLLANLGVDLDIIFATPSEEEYDEHLIYYMDLIPVINMVRVIRHLKVLPDLGVGIYLNHLLHPNTSTSHSLLYLMFNFMIFRRNQLNEVAPYEAEYFSKEEEVKALEDENNKLIEMLNVQAKEKGERSERLQRIDYDTKQFEEELKLEREACIVEKQEVATLMEELKHLEASVEQRRAHRDALLIEVARKKALRVYDAEDIKAQVEQAQANVQEAQEISESLRAALMQKENSLQNLQNIKSNLDAANNYLYEITKLSQTLKALENEDVECEGPEGELEVLSAQLKDVTAQLAEVRAARADRAAARADADDKRRRERAELTAALEDTQLQDKKISEDAQKALSRIEEVKAFTTQLDEEWSTLNVENEKINEDLLNQVKALTAELLDRFLEAEKIIMAKVSKMQEN